MNGLEDEHTGSGGRRAVRRMTGKYAGDVQSKLFSTKIKDPPVPVGQSPCQSDEDGDLWFSEDPAEIALAQSLCKLCPFQRECEEQRTGSEYGVWAGVWYGGITPAEALRREIRELREDDPDITIYRIGKRLGVGRSSVQWALHMIEKEDAA